MKSFDAFLAESAEYGTGVNLVFEAGMYSLSSDLENIVKALREAGVSFEIAGGVAVNAHILPLHRSRSFVTRYIDVLLDRNDLERAAKAAEPLGYRAKKMMGGYALVRSEQELAEAVHLLPHPSLHPEEKDFLGISVPIAPLRDLLQMTLTSFRPKDLVHLEILDEARLITPALEKDLPLVLRQRLGEARKQIADDKPDIEG